MTEMSRPTEPVAVVLAYIAAINAHDPDAVCRLVTEDFFNEHTSVRGTSFRGRAQYRRRLDGFLAEMGDLAYEIEDLVAARTTVVLAYRMSARWRHDGREHPFSTRGVFWFEVRGGTSPTGWTTAMASTSRSRSGSVDLLCIAAPTPFRDGAVTSPPYFSAGSGPPCPAVPLQRTPSRDG